MTDEFPEIDLSALQVEIQGWLASLEIPFSDEDFINERSMTRYLVFIYDALVLKIDIIPKIVEEVEKIRILIMDGGEESYPLISVRERDASMFQMDTSFKKRFSDNKIIVLAKEIAVDLAMFILENCKNSEDFHQFFKESKYYKKS